MISLFQTYTQLASLLPASYILHMQRRYRKSAYDPCLNYNVLSVNTMPIVFCLFFFCKHKKHTHFFTFFN